MKNLLLVLLLALSACASEPKLDPAAQDAALANQVRQTLEASTDVNGWNIKVDSHEGNVTLTGTAGSLQQKQAAERLAGTVAGVKMVFNQLVIKE